MHGFLMGGTGLEPVTPSLSIRGSVRVSSLEFAQTARLSRIWPATERLSERERTLIPCHSCHSVLSQLRIWTMPNTRSTT